MRRAILATMLAVATLATVMPTQAAAVTPDSTAADVASATARLAQLNNRVEQARAALDAISRKLAEDQEREADLGKKIAALARVQYEHPAPTLMQLLTTRSLSDVLAEIAQQRLVDTKKRRLLDQVRDIRRQDQSARDQAAAQLDAIKASRDEASKLAAEAEARHQSALAAAAAAVARPVIDVPAAGSGNHFAYGFCTWYVANKRYIPWFGNAIDWWPNAAAYGYPEGQQPQVGAVMVTRESGYGHVAYVERVNADGSWLISEMNYYGWAVVDTRTIRPGQVPLVGFIYNK